MTETTRMPTTRCPACHEELDATTEAMPDGHGPEAGSVSICLTCGHLMVFNADLTLREPTAEEAKALRNSPFIEYLQAERQKVMRKGSN